MAEANTKNVQQVWWQAANAPWMLQRRPFRVAPHVYYVGNNWVGAYLLDGGSELALIDTMIFEDAYQLINSIWELGFAPQKIRKILLTHCHIDHSGGVNPIKSLSGAKVWQSKEDTAFLKHPANAGAGNMFKVVDYEVDEFFSDDKPVTVGNLTVHTKLTPGHTPGTTSFFIEDQDENGKRLVVALHGGVGTNTMGNDFLDQFHLGRSLRSRFIEDCKAMKSNHVDISLPSHPAHGDLFQRLGADSNDYTTFINSQEWAHFLDIRREFAEQLEK